MIFFIYSNLKFTFYSLNLFPFQFFFVSHFKMQFPNINTFNVHEMIYSS